MEIIVQTRYYTFWHTDKNNAVSREELSIRNEGDVVVMGFQRESNDGYTQINAVMPRRIAKNTSGFFKRYGKMTDSSYPDVLTTIDGLLLSIVGPGKEPAIADAYLRILCHCHFGDMHMEFHIDNVGPVVRLLPSREQMEVISNALDMCRSEAGYAKRQAIKTADRQDDIGDVIPGGIASREFTGKNMLQKMDY